MMVFYALILIVACCGPDMSYEGLNGALLTAQQCMDLGQAWVAEDVNNSFICLPWTLGAG